MNYFIDLSIGVDNYSRLDFMSGTTLSVVDRIFHVRSTNFGSSHTDQTVKETKALPLLAG